MLNVVDLVHRLPGSDAASPLLNHLNCTIDKGQSVAIVGASGSGKTTLLSFLAGLDTPSEGEVRLAGQNIAQMDEEARAAVRAESVAFVFQNFQLIDGLTALQNVCLPLEVKGERNPEQAAKTWLQRVGLEHRLNHRPNVLSGGEQQRVALARAFACNAPLLFADEPTGSLDTETGEKVANLLFDLVASEQQTLVLVTHDPELAKRCDRTLVLQGGQLVERT